MMIYLSTKELKKYFGRERPAPLHRRKEDPTVSEPHYLRPKKGPKQPKKNTTNLDYITKQRE